MTRFISSPFFLSFFFSTPSVLAPGIQEFKSKRDWDGRRLAGFSLRFSFPHVGRGRSLVET